METVSVSITWTGPDGDVLALYADPTARWIVDPIDFELAIYRAVDVEDRETGAVIGLEIVGFLDFDRWEELPHVSSLVRIGENEPRPLREALQREFQQDTGERTRPTSRRAS